MVVMKTKPAPQRAAIASAWVNVVEEEAHLRDRTLRDLSLALTGNSPNLLGEYRRIPRVPTLEMIFRVERELGLSASEQVVRVERRLQENGQ